MKMYNVNFSDYGITVEVAPGFTLLEAAEKAGIVVQAECGGDERCGKCEAAIFAAPGNSDIQNVLMCRHKVISDVNVEIISPSVSCRVQEFSVLYDYKSNGKKETGLNNIKEMMDDELAVAFDIGTSSLCARLFNLRTGEVLSSSVCSNPQRVYGADVSSRCAYINGNTARLQKLNKSVISKSDEMIRWMCDRAGVSPGRVVSASVSGNTIMMHVFMGVDPTGIGEAPYTPVFIKQIETTGENVGLKSIPTAAVITLPCVSGYIGADAVAAAIRMGMYEPGGARLLADLGTNAEIILSIGDRIYACAAAAGPSLEGAHMSCGTTASPGAVCAVTISDNVHYSVIDDCEPHGICGTGLLDAVSEMLRHGIINRAGRLMSSQDLNLPETLEERVLNDDNKRRFVIVSPMRTKNKRSISISDMDVRAFQLGKSAVRTGIEVLLKMAGISADQLECIYLAGALGVNINPDSAVIAGVIPPLASGKIISVGNAALDGTMEALLHKEKMRAACDLATRISYIELSSVDGFMDMFVDNMPFVS